MDTVTLIGLIGSIVSIVSFLISLFMQSSKNTMSINNGTTSNNLNISNSFNSNSFNTTNNTTNITFYNSNSTSNSKFNIYDAISIFASACTFILAKFYLNHQTKIISTLLLILLILCIISSSITLLIYKKSASKHTFYIIKRLILNWFPLFVITLFINKPLYSSSTLALTKNLIMQSQPISINYFKILIMHIYDSSFISFQVIALSGILFLAIKYFYITLKDLVSALKNNTIEYKKSYKYFLDDLIIYIVILSLLSGLFQYFLLKISSLQKPL